MTKIRSARSIGYCIYCGANESDLSKEHIVPLALGGNMALPKASCSKCAVITSQFERFCARKVLGPFRVRTGAPTRRPNLRPTNLPLGLIDLDGGRREEEHSVILTLLVGAVDAARIPDRTCHYTWRSVAPTSHCYWPRTTRLPSA